MLKEHLKKHFNKIRTIKLKRHHYILWWFWIAAIVMFASIIWFQNINTHATDSQQNGVACSLTINKLELTVWDRWIASIHCISRWSWELPAASTLNADDLIEYTTWILSLEMYDFPVIIQEECTEELCQWDRWWSDDEKTYRIRYTWIASWNSTFNLRENVILWNWAKPYNWVITVTERDTTKPDCRFDLNATDLVVWLSSTWTLTCTWVNSWFNITTWLLSYDTWILEITKLWNENERNIISTQREEATLQDRWTIDFTLTFRYKGTWEWWTTTIGITWEEAQGLWINNVESDPITVIAPNCYRTRPVTGTYITIGNTWTASFVCLNMSWEISQSNISYSWDVLNITRFTTWEINSSTQMEEREQEVPQRWYIWVQYTLTYEWTWEWTTRFTINNIPLWVINVQSEEIHVSSTKDVIKCWIDISKTGIALRETWIATPWCKGITESHTLTTWDITYDSGVIELTYDSCVRVDPGTTNATYKCTFTYKWIKTWSSQFILNENAMWGNPSVTWDKIIVGGWLNETVVNTQCTRTWDGAIWVVGWILVQINEGSESRIDLTCNEEDIPELNLREIIEITTIDGTAPIIDTWRVSLVAEQHSVNSTEFGLMFTWQNSWQVKLTLDWQLTGWWTTYIFTQKNTWFIEVLEKWWSSYTDTTLCTWWDPTPNPIWTWVGAYIDLICDLSQYYSDNQYTPRELITFSGTNNNIIATWNAEFLGTNWAWWIRYNYTWDNLWTVQLYASWDAQWHQYLSNEYSTWIVVTGNVETPSQPELKLTLDPLNSWWTNHSINIYMEWTNINRVKYYKTNIQITNNDFETCENEWSSLPSNPYTTGIITQWTTYIYLCWAWLDWTTGMRIWTYQIDMTEPTFTLNGSTVYECQDWTATITDASWWLSWLPEMAYSWNWWEYWNLTTFHTWSKSSTWTETVTVKVKDNAWNTETQNTTITWQNHELEQTSTTKPLWEITTSQIRPNVTWDFWITAWSCETITWNIVGMSDNVTCTPNWNELTITPNQNINWEEWYCEIEFTDWETRLRGRYTFTVNTVVDVAELILTMDPEWTNWEWTGNNVLVWMTGQNTTWVKHFFTWTQGITKEECRNYWTSLTRHIWDYIYYGNVELNSQIYIYLCWKSLTWELKMISWEYKIDKTSPTITFSEQNGSTAPSHSVTVTVNDWDAWLQAGQSIQYKWTTGECWEDWYSDIALSPTAAWTHTATGIVTTPSNLADWEYYLCIKTWSVYDQAWNTNTWTKTSWVFVIWSESIPMPSCFPTYACFSWSSTGIVCTGSEWTTLHFTTDLSEPTCTSDTWTDRSFNETTTLKIIACDWLWHQSQIREHTYYKDTTAPSTQVSGVPSDWTWNNVTLTFSTSTENMGCSDSHTTYYCIYNSWDAACTPDTEWTSAEISCESGTVCQKYIRYYSTDLLWNTEAIQETGAIRIDKKAPVCWTVEFNPATWTTGNVTWTFTATDEWAWLSPQTQSPKILIIGANWLKTATFRDNVWNSTDCTWYVGWIDRTPATWTIVPTYPSWNLSNQCTSGDVILTLTWEDANWLADDPYSRDWTTRTWNASITLTDNASWTWYIKDAAGNVTQIPYNITWISHSWPSINLTAPSSWEAFTWYVEFEWNITATNPTCQEINWWYHIVIYSWWEEYYTWTTTSTNTWITLPDWDYTWKIYVIDILWHRSDSDILPFSVNQNAPTCNIEYTPAEWVWTNGSVRAILTWCSEWATWFNQTWHEFEENWEFTFTFTNDLWISNIKVANVRWIDKIPPFISWHTNTTTWWYTWDLVYSFIYEDTWAWISGENTISCTINTEWTWQTCSITDVNVCDRVWNCNNKPVASQGINLDKSNPICWTWWYNPWSGSLTTWDVEVTLTWSYDTISQINVSWWNCTITWNNQNCNITISDNAWNTEACTSENVTWIDKTAPILHEVTPIWTTEDTTPNYTFSSTESGTITYSGACSSATTWAVSWNNTITLNQLAYWTYSWCTITVTDIAWNKSEILTISRFTIRQSWGGGGGWWGTLKKDDCPDGDYSDSYYDRTCEWPKDVCWVSKSKYDNEMKTAYLYSYLHGMTTKCPIDEANLYWTIRRDELAKMLTEYAIEVLDLKPEAGKSGCTAYNDIADSSAEMRYYMKTACELNIMWLESDGKTPMKSFYPHWLVSRAEFGTTLSRLIYGDAYNLESEAENTYPWAWYGKHLEALKRDEIMTQIYWNRPQHLELRWYVMLMIMRHWKARLDNVKDVPYSTTEEIMAIYNKNKALTCEVSYYESADDHGSWMIYVKDNKLRENYKIYKEWNLSALLKNNKLYIRWDALWTWMWMVADVDSTALEELEAMLEDDTYTFKNCNEAVKNINAFEIPSNVKFKTLGDWFTEVSDSFTSLFE